MKRRHFNHSLAFTLGAGLAAMPNAVSAQAWPDKPIKFILSQPPGSGPDNVARLLAERLARNWGQAVVIDNKPGGQNIIGAQAAARSPADGSHFYFATTAALVSNAYLFKSLPYDPQRDFTSAAFIARSAFGVLVNAESPLRSLADVLARAKAEPGRVTLGNEGPRTFSGMIARLLAARAAVNFNQVPYASIAVAIQNALGAQVDAIVADLPSSAGLIKSGKLRLLAVTSAQRLSGWEGVPTVAETLSGFEMVGWFALVAPNGTPSAVLLRVNRDVNAVLNDAEFAQRVAAIGPLVDGSLSLEGLADFLRAEHARWAAMARDIGLLPE